MATNPSSEKNDNWGPWFRKQAWNLLIVFLAVVDAVLFVHAIESKHYYLAQATLLGAVALVFAGVAGLTRTFSLAPVGSDIGDAAEAAKADEKERQREKNRSKWLTRLVLVAALGLSAIVLYAIQYEHWALARVASTASVGFMAAGATWLAGALLGFLFGIPHTRPAASESNKQIESTGQELADNASQSRQGDHRYEPSTSLEQISDWLTKIIVGVGLTQLANIPPKLGALASYISRGMGGDQASTSFALGICIYFSVCGFFFGYLWARLYMIQAFRAADEVHALEEKVSRLEEQQQADARALALVQQQLNRDADDPAAPAQEVAKVIKAASPLVKAQIFSQARKTSANTKADNYEVKLESVISIFRGLIASDKDERFHRNHYELSMALRRMKPRRLQEAVNEITKAIEIRDKREEKGWKFHEFHRARCLINLIPDSEREKPSERALVERIVSDLRAAYTDSDKWKQWYEENENVRKWMAINQIELTTLQQS